MIAACGVHVAKHGNRSVSSRCGSADVFEALGVNIAASPATVERTLRDTGIAFFFAPTFHPSMKHAAQTRRDLGIRTAFNLLGPLTNPAGATRQLVGVPRPELTELLARALMMLGSERAWVVHGADGIDEISTTGYTKVSECRDGAVNTFYLHPADVGLPKATQDVASRWRRGGERPHHDRSPGRPARCASRRGAVECRRRAVRAGSVTSIQEGLRRRSAASDRGEERAGRSALMASISKTEGGVFLGNRERRHDGHRSGPDDLRPDLLATIVAATRRIVEVRQAT